MASPSVRQHRAPTVPRQGPAHVRSRLSGGSSVDPMQTYLNDNAAAWWSSQDITGGMTGWVPRVGSASDELFLGLTASSETSDPTINTGGAINTLECDGVDDKMTLASPSSGLLPSSLTDENTGSFTLLISGYSGTTPSGTRYLGGFRSSGVARAVIFRRSSGAYGLYTQGLSGPGTVTGSSDDIDATDGERITVALIVDGNTQTIATETASGSASYDQTRAGAAGANDADYFQLGINPINNGSTQLEFDYTDVAIFQLALTTSQVSDFHDFFATSYT